jgi:hypothetical protein
MRYNQQERDSIMLSGSRLIVITGESDHAEKAQIFVDSRRIILEFLQLYEPPFIARLNRSGIHMWLSVDNWMP